MMTFLLPDTPKQNAETPLPRHPLESALPALPGNRYPRIGPEERLRARREMDGGFRRSPRPLGRATEPAPGANARARKVTVLLPALNEEEAVGSVIDRVPIPALGRSGYDVKVWVVDGQSTDSTLAIARERGAAVFVQSGRGKGNGIRQALDYLRERPRSVSADSIYVMLDADGSYPPEQIRRLLAALDSGADVVLGSRFLGHIEEGAIPNLNRLGNRLLSRMASLLFGVPVSDVCTGMWGFREGCLRGFSLVAEGFDFEADLYSAACLSGVRIAEVPVDYHRRVGEPKLVPLRTGLLIGWRLLARKLNRPAPPARRPGLRRDRPAEEPT